jgi:hypothetical protein
MRLEFAPGSTYPHRARHDGWSSAAPGRSVSTLRIPRPAPTWAVFGIAARRRQSSSLVLMIGGCAANEPGRPAAMDTVESVRVAIKVPHEEHLSEELFQSFRQEVRLFARLITRMSCPSKTPARPSRAYRLRQAFDRPARERSFQGRRAHAGSISPLEGQGAQASAIARAVRHSRRQVGFGAVEIR